MSQNQLHSSLTVGRHTSIDSAAGQSVLAEDGTTSDQGADSDGHGTMLVATLLKVSPFCEVYVAKVFENRYEMTDRLPSPLMSQRVANVGHYFLTLLNRF